MSKPGSFQISVKGQLPVCSAFTDTFFRKEHLPSETDSAIPRQAQMAKPSDPVSMLRSAEQVLKCDVRCFFEAGRVSGPEKINVI